MPEPLPVRLLYDKREAAAMLHVSIRTIDRLVRRGALAAVRVESSVRFTLASLQRFIEAQEPADREPRPPSEAEQLLGLLQKKTA